MQKWELLIVLYTNEEGAGIMEKVVLELHLKLSQEIFFNETVYQWPSVGRSWYKDIGDVFETDWNGNWSHVDVKTVIDSIGKWSLPH